LIYKTRRKFKLHVICAIILVLAIISLIGAIYFKLYLVIIFPALLIGGTGLMLYLDSEFLELIITEEGIQMPKRVDELGVNNFIPFSKIDKIKVNEYLKRIVIETNGRKYPIPSDYTNIYWLGIIDTLKKTEWNSKVVMVDDDILN